MVLEISRSRKRKKSTLWLWLFLSFLLLIIIAVVLYFILAGKKTPSGPGQGPSGPTPSGPPGPPGPPPGPTPKDDLTDCLALNFYGSDTGGAAPQKICGVFDGFSHWSWAGMQQWLAYFSYKTGAKRVIIYEAQFVPESWMTEVGATITNPVKGKKRSANLLPMTCESDKVCKGDVTTGTDKAPGLNWKCTDDICVDQCLVAPSPQCTATGGQCVKHYKSLNCPHSGYCRKDNNSCHYDTPHSGDGPSMKSCTKAADCTCPDDSCNFHGGTCHKTLQDGNCLNPPGAGGTCPSILCPGKNPSPGKRAAYCGDNGYCKYCWSLKGKSISPPCQPKEEYTEGRPLWSAWGDSASAPSKNAKTAGFSTYYTSVGSLWDGTHLKGVKGGKGAALCPYGSFYDPSPGVYGQCVEHKATCTSPETATNMMGFCDKPFDPSIKPVGKGKSISVYVGKSDPKADPTGYAMLQIPEITLTWYALVGAAQHKGNVAIDYIKTVLDFCHQAGISRLAFPFIVPDNQNYAPYMIANTDGSIPPSEGYGKAQVTNAMKWLVTHLLTPAKGNGREPPVEIGLNVYASSKDARWQQWWRGGGVPTCFTDPCPADNEKACNAITSTECTWQKKNHTECGCFPVQNPPNLCVESFTTGGPMTPDPCSGTDYAQCKTGSCSWPYIATFIKLLNAQANKANAQQVTFLQVDQEWCHCGELADNVAIVHKIIPSVEGRPFEFTIATSLGTAGSTPGSPAPHTSVPEVYWDAGNQFPCTGGPGTYEYLTPPCTSWSSHRKLKNQPKAFYDLMVGDSNHGGSDDNSDEGKPNAWLGRGKFNATVNSLKNEGNLTVTPSFSIENLSMCSEPNEMQLTGDTKNGTARWQCLPKK